MDVLPDLHSLDDSIDSYSDAALSAKTSDTRNTLIEMAARLGFKRACVETEVDNIWNPKSGGKKKKKEDLDNGNQPPSNPVPHPSSLGLPQPDGLRLFSRLTFPLTDPIQINKMASNNVLAYDIIAVEPEDERLFHKVCTESENIDLVTFKYSSGNTPSFKIQRSIVKVAIERGLHFEINIGPGLRTSTNARQHLISYGTKIVTATKGKNIILSSGAIKSSEMRGPYDLMNLGVLFGMKQDQAKDAVSKNFSALLRHSLTRQFAGGAVQFKREIHCGSKMRQQLVQLRKVKAFISKETGKSKSEIKMTKDLNQNKDGTSEKDSEIIHSNGNLNDSELSSSVEKRKADDLELNVLKKVKVNE